MSTGTDDRWRPGSSRETLRVRAHLLRALRAFLDARGVIEVDTPVVARFGVTDPAIEALLLEGENPRFLQTSPEYAMKRLLAAGSGPIYQLGKAFRAGEAGARHNPEFTLLEWYRPGFSLEELMREVAELVIACGAAAGREAPAVEYYSYRELFAHGVGVDPLSASVGELAAAAGRFADIGDLDLTRDGWLDLLMTHAVEPSLRGPRLVFVYDYPASQAALARRVERDDGPVADRFEVYLQGIELANGYRELLDAGELARRADADGRARADNGQPARELDPRLVAAQEFGLPDCSGVALGVDRLLMALLGEDRIEHVMPFDWTRC